MSSFSNSDFNLIKVQIDGVTAMQSTQMDEKQWYYFAIRGPKLGCTELLAGVY